MGASDSKGSEDQPPDTVLLHGGFPRGAKTPSPSPFVLKVETFLRINKIPYQFTDKGGFSAKDRVPWIQYNEDTVCDSHFIIKYLNKKFNVDLDKNLSEGDKATSTAFKIMVAEFLTLVLPLHLLVWNTTDGIKKLFSAPTPVIWLLKQRISSRLKTQGIGSHSREEVDELAQEQLSAISVLLGDKPYMFGEEPTELDCTVFGILAEMKFNMEEDMQPRKLIEEKYTNLNEYVERMKTNFYPDWDELLQAIDTNNNKTTPKE